MFSFLLFILSLILVILITPLGLLFTTAVLTPLVFATPAKALGVTTTTSATWFTQTGNNEVTYNSALTKDLLVTVDLSVDGGANDEIVIYVRRWDNSASAYVVEKEKTRGVYNLLGGNDIAIFSFTARINDMMTNDRIEIWISNATDSTNATIEQGSEIFVEVL